MGSAIYKPGHLQKTLSGMDWAFQGNEPAVRYTVRFADGRVYAWVLLSSLISEKHCGTRIRLARDIRRVRAEARKPTPEAQS